MTGNISVKGTMASGDVNVSTGLFTFKTGVGFGSAEYENGNLQTDVMQTSSQVSMSKNTEDDNISSKREISQTGEISLGARLGIIGINFTAAPIKVVKGIVGMFEAIGNYVNETFKEGVPTFLGGYK